MEYLLLIMAVAALLLLYQGRWRRLRLPAPTAAANMPPAAEATLPATDTPASAGALHPKPVAEAGYTTLIQHWVWDVLYPLDGQNQFIAYQGFENSRLAALLGAEAWFANNEAFDPVHARHYLKQHYTRWQQTHQFDTVWQQGLPGALPGNLEQWARLLDLNNVETRLLAFTVILHLNGDLMQATNLLGDQSKQSAVWVLAYLLRLPENEVTAALAQSGRLYQSGLLRLDNNSDYCLRNKIDLMSHRFAELMVSEQLSPTDILRQHIRPAPTTALVLADFAHLGELAEATPQYLAHVLQHQQAGCNILIHGVAGTGKTEFAQVLAQSVGAELFEIAWADDEGNPAGRDARMSALRAAQSILSGQNLVLLFDEIEDVFDAGQEHFSLNKAWLNRTLENNAVPTIWVCNQVAIIDPSAVRRFDLVLHMKAPPIRNRRRMIEAYAGDFLAPPALRRLAEQEAVVPALLKQAHKVTAAVGGDWPQAQKGALFEKIIHNTLQAQGVSSMLNQPARLPEIYRLDWIHSRQDLAAIAEGIIRHGRASLCLYGAPGTGKSAYAAWMAEQLGRPLIYKRSSDLLSKYVGETEQRIAEAFAQAQDNQAVLVFDEVDGFLQDRRQARQSWEVTQVNEMLTQMEAFAGVFVASTNLMKNLDQAALRRFDFKIEFLPLRADQAWSLFQAHCQQLGLECPAPLHAEVVRLRQLVPGDFAVAAKQSRLTPLRRAEDLLAALRHECSLKEGAQGHMGFM